MGGDFNCPLNVSSYIVSGSETDFSFCQQILKGQFCQFLEIKSYINSWKSKPISKSNIGIKSIANKF